MKALLIGASLAALAFPAFAGTASGVPGTLDQTLVQPSNQAVPVGAALCPNGGTVVRGAANVANTSAVATLAAPSNGTTNYLAGFTVTSGGATSAALVTVTIANLAPGALQYTYGAPAGATAIAQPLSDRFAPMIPAGGANTAITVTVPALGTGNTNTTVVAYGCQF